MRHNEKLEKIIQDHLPALQKGEETVDSILGMYPDETVVLRSHLEAALWLVKTREKVEPRSGFIPSSRKYLEQRLASARPHNVFQRFVARYSPQRWAFNLVAPLIVLLLFALVINNVVLTARLSIPGDPLYSTKLFIEDTQLAFTFNPEKKANLYIEFTRERTTEFVQLVLEGDYARLPQAAGSLETDIIATLHYLHKINQASRVSETPEVILLKESLDNEIALLKVLKGTSPASAEPGIELAIDVARAGVMALR